MNQDRVSARQIYVILFAALLTPAVRALPTWTAAIAGRGAWLTGCLAFPVLLFAAWVVCAILKTTSGGLAQGFQAVLGPFFGKTLTIIYMVWALFLLSLEARLYSERMLDASAKSASLPVLVLVLLALVFWMGQKKLTAFARASEIFYLVLAVILVSVLAFSVVDLTPDYILPVWTEDVPAVARATPIVLGVAAAGIFAAFLGGRVKRAESDRRRGLGWLVALCATLTALQLGVLAQLGPQLAAGLEYPFFEVARGVGVAGAFQRVDAVVVAMWLFSGLAFLGLLLFALRAMAESLWGAVGEKWTPAVAVILSLLGALFLFPDGFAAKKAAETWAIYGNLILGMGVPLAVLLVQKSKATSGRVHI